jgi:KDO2-lipid IV(A) lauroyltransferase
MSSEKQTKKTDGEEMNNMKVSFLSICCYRLCYVFSLLPLRVMYVMADMLYFLLYDVLRYRRKIVRSNLTISFPEKSQDEIKRIERKFYHWLSDYFFESIKLLSISKEEVQRRYTFVNPEVFSDAFDGGQNIGTILGHYCNWEWLSCTQYYMPEGSVLGLIYKPLSNDVMDYIFYKLRSHAHGVAIPKKDILRYLVKYKREGVMNLFGYIADQAPKWENIHLWIPFMGHETGVFTGAERIMRKMNDAVYYVEMGRPRRGYYTCTLRLITKEPNTLEEYEITRRFFKMLEENIRQHPEYYLWTHNRWKRTHEEFDQRFTEVNGKVIKRSET